MLRIVCLFLELLTQNMNLIDEQTSTRQERLLLRLAPGKMVAKTKAPGRVRVDLVVDGVPLLNHVPTMRHSQADTRKPRQKALVPNYGVFTSARQKDTTEVSSRVGRAT